MITISKLLNCDRCTRADDFGLMQPATAAELRLEGRRMGWKRRSGRDICNVCAFIEAQPTNAPHAEPAYPTVPCPRCDTPNGAADYLPSGDAVQCSGCGHRFEIDPEAEP